MDHALEVAKTQLPGFHLNHNITVCLSLT